MLAKKTKQDVELKWLDNRVKRLIRQGKIDKKKIYLFGVNIRTRKTVQVLRKYGLEPVNILDNDETKQNSYCSRIRVIAIDQIENISDNENIYIICSAYWREMLAQLENKGVKKSNIFRFYHLKKTLLKHFFDAWQGGYIYQRLIKKYGNAPVFLCPYTGTGDIYLIGTFWKEYIRRKEIENYIFIVVNEACKKVAMLFGINNIELLKKKRYCSHLINYYLLYPEKIDMIILNDSWPHIHTNPIEWFRGYKGLNFTEMFRRYVFNLSEYVKPEHPIFANVEKELIPLFTKYHLVSGKTVVLSPYSNTLADLPDIFWEDLAEDLKNKGYTVCTNSNGKNEPAISGTISVFFPLNIAPQFMEKAGYFIGVRSGLCDVICAAKAKKIILYDAEERFYMGSSFEYFSLRHMGLCNDAVEIEYRHDELERTLSEIIVNI